MLAMAVQTAATGKDVVNIDSNSNHHVIDIGGDDGGSGSGSAPNQPLNECAVCTEPLEWVAVGACGHRVVCAACVVRLRFVQGDHRCCVCRKYCLTVVVTRADAAERRAVAELARVSVLFPAALETTTQQCWWYHGGASAYFDDEKQYEAAAKACEADANVHGAGASSRGCQPAVVLLIFIFLGICSLVSFAIWRTVSI